MKILPVEKVREADSYTIQHEPIADIDLMERAAGKCFEWILGFLTEPRAILIFAGSGNNGGDGLAIARKLHQKGFRTEVFLFADQEHLSSSCSVNYDRYQSLKKAKVSILNEKRKLPVIHPEDVVIDALFGSGLTRTVTGFPADVIRHINDSPALVIAIDVPSGMFTDITNRCLPEPSIIFADHTLTFAPPKLGFFFPENDRFVGSWHLLDIGIQESFINQVTVKNFYTQEEEISKLLKPRGRYAHKGDFGHALLICGGEGKAGAAVLASRACLRSGAGLVTVKTVASCIPVVQTAVPEAMCTTGGGLEPYSAIAVGPGIGQSVETAKDLKILIQESPVPLILDADALNILGNNRTWLRFLPEGSILTPHPKEFERLAGPSKNDFHRNELQKELSFKCQAYVVLKGAHTCITTPDGMCYFNSTGNPGMATGGAGDVLTGILAGLYAQGYSALDTCLLGVYLHGLAGDVAVRIYGQESLIAGDIINYLGSSFLSLYGKF